MPDDGVPYTVVVAAPAHRALSEELPANAAVAAWEFIIGPLASRPHVVGAALREPVLGLWRAKRGDYRVRYRIDESTRTVMILDVDHRRDAYRA